jgi:hypothetical protein
MKKGRNGPRPTKTIVRVEKLVLASVDRPDGREIEKSAEQSLARLFAQRALASRDARTIDAKRSGIAEQIGQQIADSVYETLARRA